MYKIRDLIPSGEVGRVKGRRGRSLPDGCWMDGRFSYFICICGRLFPCHFLGGLVYVHSFIDVFYVY